MFCELTLKIKIDITDQQYEKLLYDNFKEPMPINEAVKYTIFKTYAKNIKQSLKSNVIFATIKEERVLLFYRPEMARCLSVHIETIHSHDLYLLRRVSEDIASKMETIINKCSFDQRNGDTIPKRRIEELSMVFTAEGFTFLAADRMSFGNLFWRDFTDDLFTKALVPIITFITTGLFTQNWEQSLIAPVATVLVFSLWVCYKINKQKHFYYHDINIT